LPEQYQLTDIIKSLPREVFTFNPLKAWGQILLTVLATGAGVYLLTLSPWYLVPLVWIYTGTAATGLFVVAHDCGHRSFARSDLLSDVVGHALLLPLVYPFHPWRIMHNLHHANTNKYR
jgi:omega-6 fatty acid desaturase (delta-12 desaturase)